MKLIAGLGNPGPRYEHTRHNVGFMVADETARRWNIQLRYERGYEGLVGDGVVAGERTLLLKPQTLMNLSGRSVAALARFYKLALGDLLVVLDDLDLPVGGLRMRADGSSGGHRGLSDVIEKLGSQEIARLRIGIGRVHRCETVGHVLGTFAPDEREAVAEVVQTAADAVECWATRGVQAAMNAFNRRRGDENG